RPGGAWGKGDGGAGRAARGRVRNDRAGAPLVRRAAADRRQPRVDRVRGGAGVLRVRDGAQADRLRGRGAPPRRLRAGRRGSSSALEAARLAPAYQRDHRGGGERTVGGPLVRGGT